MESALPSTKLPKIMALNVSIKQEIRSFEPTFRAIILVRSDFVAQD